jgi:hypothetical protein
MKRYLHRFLVSILLVVSITGYCQERPSADFPKKNWHSPYQVNRPTSQFFQVVDWDTLSYLKVGLPIDQLKNLGFLVLEPYRNADALLFSFNPKNIKYEIELKFSKQKISDISYRVAEPSLSLQIQNFKIPRFQLTPEESEQGAAANP